MRKATRLGIALLFGLLTFIAPLLGGSEQELATVGRAAVFVGIAPVLLACALKERQWISDCAERHAGKLIAALGLTVLALGYYLFVYFRPGFPTETMFMWAVAAYAVFSAGAAAGLTLLGYLAALRVLPHAR